MPSSILNSDDGVISGTAGLKNSGGDDGVLVFQSKGTETARINTDKQIVAAAGTALLPSITTTGDVNTGIFFSAANTVDIATDGVARAQINSAGDFAINAGFGSVGKAFLCRAWVNFDGTAASNLSGTYARTSPSTTVTVTATAHGLIVGSSVNLDFTTGTGLDGVYTVVTVANANTFTVTTVASTTTSGNVTLLRNTIRASGNVSSITDNGTGSYTVNFTTAMPDANYAILGTTNMGGAGINVGIDSSSAIAAPTSKTTTGCRVQSITHAGTAIDSENQNYAIFR